MAVGTAVDRGTVRANGAVLYREVRGSGPALVFVSSATGDAGHYARVADALADRFTVVTYDRRGNSRSPAPDGWTATSIDEQADDLAALIETLGIRPAVVFGSGGGGVIVTNLLLRHPDAVRGAVIHEPALVSVLPYADEVNAALQALVEEGFARGGPRPAMEAFVRAAAGDATFETIDPATRERMLANGELFFAVELAAFASYAPDADALRSIAVPIVVCGSHATRDDAGSRYLWDAARWMADTIAQPLCTLSGGHGAYIDRPEIFAAEIRPVLEEMHSR